VRSFDAAIEERIADIEKLDALRRRARMLREQAIEAVTGKICLPRPRQKADRWVQDRKAQEAVPPTPAAPAP
jgi:hypothetical protein